MSRYWKSAFVLSLVTLTIILFDIVPLMWRGQLRHVESIPEPSPTFSHPDQESDSAEPENPKRNLIRKAERNGIDKVRGEFQGELTRQLTQLEQSQEIPFSIGRGSPAGKSAASVMDWAESWCLAEAQSIYRGAEVPDSFDDLVWRPLFDAAVTSNSIFREALRELEKSRDDHVQVVDAKSGEGKVDLIKAEVFDHEWNRTIRMHDKYSEAVFLRLADLAKLAKRKDLLEKLYQAYGKPLPKLGERSSRLGELKSAEEFWAYNSPLSEKWYGIPKPITRKVPDPEPQFPVSAEEQTAIRTVVETFLKALVAKDLETIKSVSGDADLKLLEKKFTERTTSRPIYACDVTNAQFTFSRDEKDGPVRVDVDGLEIETDFGGQRQRSGARKTYQIVFVNEIPKLILNTTEQK